MPRAVERKCGLLKDAFIGALTVPNASHRLEIRYSNPETMWTNIGDA
jgi:hypothetical protein